MFFTKTEDFEERKLRIQNPDPIVPFKEIASIPVAGFGRP
jgi:hypothetical protein